MTQVWETIENLTWTILHRPRLNDILDILLVAAIVYKLLMLTRDTRGSAVLKGLLLLLVVVGVSNFFGLTALNWLLTAVVNNGPLVLVILFQPEIRKALESIGRGAKLEKVRNESEDEAGRIVHEIVQCLLSLSRRRVGALIVFEQKTGLQDVIENGIGMDAQISAGLLENIFEPNTPLHDGAVVIRDRRIMSAASFLSLTDASGISHDLGTRHRAALGVSETTDALVLIVSEETGIISMARGGKLTRYLDHKALRGILEGLYKPQQGKSHGASHRDQAQPVRQHIKRHMYARQAVEPSVQRRQANTGSLRPGRANVHRAYNPCPQRKCCQPQKSPDDFPSVHCLPSSCMLSGFRQTHPTGDGDKVQATACYFADTFRIRPFSSSLYP